ncbi:hypothetical protein [Microcella sp.]|uniref:hypothetical protein n=1 Tax=Microcella sp. TaxID=1913979 RepID=UPI00299F76B9|nr:hypothetical protein [Microcella sp.]
MTRSTTGFSAARNDDRGNAMIAVVGLLAVTSMVTMTVTGATIDALGYTSLTRAGVQSNAAAEAGVDAMLAELFADDCPATGQLTVTQGAVDPALTGTAATQPFFVATIAQRVSNQAAWTPGCPNGATTQIRIQSTGFASDTGVAESASAGDASAVQAVYAWTPGANTAAVTGAAVFSYGTPGLANSLELLSFNGNSANVIVAEGNILCSNSVYVQGDIVAANGNIQLDNTCSAGGRVWASGTVTLQGNKTIGGDVIAAGTGLTRIDPSTDIGGGIFARGEIDSWGQRCSTGATGWDAAGDACSAALTTGADPVFYNRLDVAAPTRPTWVDVNFVSANWVAQGWNVLTYTGPCTIDNRTKDNSQVRAFSNYTTPTVIDMRGCSTVTFSSSANLNIDMRTDLTFIMPRTVLLEDFTAASNTNVDRALRFITPDTVADGVPTNTGCGRFDLNNQNELAAPIAVMVYTPCPVTNANQLTWRGQYYARNVSFSNNSELTYVPIGIPGFDLGNGAGGPGGSGAVGGPAMPGHPGALVEYIDIDPPA